MTDTTTLSSKFQISVPKAVRDAERWTAGQKFTFLRREGSIVLVPVPTLDELGGITEGADTSDYRDRNDRY